MVEQRRKIEEVRVFRLRMPLSIPYHVSFVRFDAFEVFLARVFTVDGEGIGETATSPGHSQRHEASELIWDSMRKQAGRLVGAYAGEALRSLEPVQNEHPFAAVALSTAIESAIQLPGVTEDVRVPLLGTVMTHDDDSTLEDEVEGLLQQGYDTLKVKVGWDEREDAERTERIQEVVGDRAIIRIDANQGYELEQATYFVDQVNPANVEVFEQPFRVGNWDDMERLAQRSPLPLMLDESIVSEEDLEKTIELGCAQAVKFKLMRAGGFGRLEHRIRRATEAGLKVILGNGVASDIGDFHELVVASRRIETAGEMNGFLKQESRLLSNPYAVSGGGVDLSKGYTPEVDWDEVDFYTVDASPAGRELSPH